MFEVEHERSKRVASATFRVSENVYRALQREADKQNTSLNTLVNQMFESHVSDRAFLEKLDYLRVNKASFRRILQGTGDESLIEAGELSGRETVRTITIARVGQLTLDTILETVCSLAEFAGCMRYSEIRTSGKQVIVLTHDLGPKWSLFISSMMSSAFRLIDYEPKITVGDNSVLVETNGATDQGHGPRRVASSP